MVGLRVIELGSTVAGPFCSRLLADFGAEVIKVEQVDGDVIRSFGHRRANRSLYNASIQRGKKIVAIDLHTEEGRSLVRSLCQGADVVVENFRAGSLERWGLGYEDLSKANPGLVLVRISGFGQDGPYCERGGYGVVCEAVSGLREITGDPDRPPPRIATSMADYIAGFPRFIKRNNRIGILSRPHFHPRRSNRHTRHGDSFDRRPLLKQTVNVRRRNMPLDDIAIHNSGMATHEFRGNSVYPLVRGYILNIEYLDLETTAAHMADPGLTTPAAGGFVNCDEWCGFSTAYHSGHHH